MCTCFCVKFGNSALFLGRLVVLLWKRNQNSKRHHLRWKQLLFAQEMLPLLKFLSMEAHSRNLCGRFHKIPFSHSAPCVLWKYKDLSWLKVSILYIRVFLPFSLTAQPCSKHVAFKLTLCGTWQLYRFLTLSVKMLANIRSASKTNMASTRSVSRSSS